MKFLSELSADLTHAYTSQHATRRFRRNVLAWLQSASASDASDASDKPKGKKKGGAAADSKEEKGFDFGGVSLNFSPSAAASVELPTLKVPPSLDRHVPLHAHSSVM